MKWYHYLICGILIVIGIFSTINLVELFSVSSQEYGSVITIETQNNYNEVSKFDLGTFTLQPTSGNQYSETITLAPEVFDGSNKDYLILFNGKPANNIDSKSGQISGDVSMTFYDLEGKEITTANFNVAIQYYVTQTVITISMTNENDSVSYLSNYTNVNGAVFSVVERSAE